MNDTSIKVSSLGIKFFLDYEKDIESNKTKLKTLKSLMYRGKRKEFWALKDINFETKKGEIFGIIGGNGAGKSTLLKVIAGIFPTTEGDVLVQGTMVPLIEIGGAFNHELTGAENIYFTGSIFRIPQKIIREHFHRIVDFSGLANFINTPVKNYSSGMFIRLAFSIVIFFQPDIVLIDEVFSVGDEAFQQKSFEKIISFKQRGATIILVSHDANIIGQICDRVLVLSHGEVSYLGTAKESIDHYHSLIKKRADLQQDGRFEQPDKLDIESKRIGNKDLEIHTVQFVDESGQSKSVFQSGEYFEAQISYSINKEDISPIFGVAISTIYKLLIYGPNTRDFDFSGPLKKEGLVRFIIPSLPLIEGDYLFSAAAYDSLLMTAYDHHENMYHFRVVSRGKKEFGSVKIDSRWEME
ncbi:MAG: ABC transporter ATP-binding protein [Candidatus Aminicenantes bacterium]|nr:ABC transporter ATP-binding protein [Candidatus Aminicenantes bacterium]